MQGWRERGREKGRERINAGERRGKGRGGCVFPRACNYIFPPPRVQRTISGLSVCLYYNKSIQIRDGPFLPPILKPVLKTFLTLLKERDGCEAKVLRTGSWSRVWSTA